MKYHIYNKIYNDKNMLKYLRENSYWYKFLNRSDEYLIKMEEEMKIKYGLRFKDKVDKVKTGLDLIDAFRKVTKE